MFFLHPSALYIKGKENLHVGLQLVKSAVKTCLLIKGTNICGFVFVALKRLSF